MDVDNEDADEEDDDEDRVVDNKENEVNEILKSRPEMLSAEVIRSRGRVGT